MPPRRKRRSAEVRNSLRLFGLLAVLAGVNVYVFFFNQGTAPREVLKPSSTFKAADGANGKVATLKEASGQAREQLAAPAAAALPVSATPARLGSADGKPKVRPPIPVGPAGNSGKTTGISGKTTAKVRPTQGLASGGGPKRITRVESAAGQRNGPAKQPSGKQSRKEVR